MSLTAAQIHDFFDESDENMDLFYDLEWLWKNEQVVNIGGHDYRALYIEGETGHEGDYNCDTYMVIRVGEQYFRIDGHYQSYEGTEWGSWYAAHSVIKPVTFWEAL